MILSKKSFCLNFINASNFQQKKIGKTFWVSKYEKYSNFQNIDLIKEMLKENK
jgi:hypothetical protein